MAKQEKSGPGRPKKDPAKRRDNMIRVNTTSVVYSALLEEAEEKDMSLSLLVHQKLAAEIKENSAD